MKKTNIINFIISSKIALHTAKPYIEELQARKEKIFFLVSDDIFDEVNNQKVTGDIVERISDYKRMNKIAMLVHQLLVILLTHTDFSTLYRRWLSQRFRNKNVIVNFIVKNLVKIFPKVKRENINRIVSYVTTFFIKQNLPGKKVINITISATPFLCAYKKKIILL